ncbi:MAG: DUF6789 family protein [Gemmatimonadales bacterium]
MQHHVMKSVTAGIAGTVVMTMMGLFVAPMMGIPRMNPAEMLAGQMGGVMLLGWVAHLMIGVILAVAYAALFAARLPGPPALRGAVYGLIPFLMAQLIVMPMMGMPLFSGSVPMAMGSLIGHLVYGMVVGALVGDSTRQQRLAAV